MKATPLKLAAPIPDGAVAPHPITPKPTGTLEEQIADLALQAENTASAVRKLDRAFRVETARTQAALAQNQATLSEIQAAIPRLHDTLVAFYQAMTAKKPRRKKPDAPGVHLHRPPAD